MGAKEVAAAAASDIGDLAVCPKSPVIGSTSEVITNFSDATELLRDSSGSSCSDDSKAMGATPCGGKLSARGNGKKSAAKAPPASPRESQKAVSIGASHADLGLSVAPLPCVRRAAAQAGGSLAADTEASMANRGIASARSSRLLRPHALSQPPRLDSAPALAAAAVRPPLTIDVVAAQGAAEREEVAQLQQLFSSRESSSHPTTPKPTASLCASPRAQRPPEAPPAASEAAAGAGPSEAAAAATALPLPSSAEAASATAPAAEGALVAAAVVSAATAAAQSEHSSHDVPTTALLTSLALDEGAAAPTIGSARSGEGSGLSGASTAAASSPEVRSEEVKAKAEAMPPAPAPKPSELKSEEAAAMEAVTEAQPSAEAPPAPPAQAVAETQAAAARTLKPKPTASEDSRATRQRNLFSELKETWAELARDRDGKTAGKLLTLEGLNAAPPYLMYGTTTEQVGASVWGAPWLGEARSPSCELQRPRATHA